MELERPLPHLKGMQMLTFVDADWVEQRVDSPEILVLDPRMRLRYMSGHVKNALNVPVARTRDNDERLLAPDDLTRFLGAAGLDDNRAPVLYDSSDGRNAAMLAWILLYLGRTDVHLMDSFWEKWIADGGEAFYRPIEAMPQEFTARVKPELRVTLDDVRHRAAHKLVDFRSREEFTGTLDMDGKPGHIPGAVNLVWRELAGTNGRFLAERATLERLVASLGIDSCRPVIAYCRTGLRAALGFLALTEMGVPVALYDGSYAEWARSGLPVESSESSVPKGATSA